MGTKIQREGSTEENTTHSPSSEKNAETIVPIHKRNLYDKITLWALTLAVLLLPIFIIPYANIGFFYAKFGLVAVVVIVAAIALILQVLNERKMEKYSLLNYFVIFSIPVLYIISSLFSVRSSVSLIGNGAELDTAYFVFLGTLLTYLVSRTFRAKHAVFMLVLGFISISSLVSLFHISRFIFGKEFLSAGLFTSITSNTIGGFAELGIYAGLTILLAMLALELTHIQKSLRTLLYVSLALSLILVAVTNFNLVLGVLGSSLGVSLSSLVVLFSLILFIHKKVAHPKEKLPIVSLAVLLLSLVFTIGIIPLSGMLIKQAGINQEEIVDVRVSQSATYEVAAKTYQNGIKDALLGVGPNKFFTAWGKYKPVDIQDSVNTTPFWNLDFNLASGFIPTSFITVGILGGLSWLFFLGMILFYVSKLLKNVAKLEKDASSVFVAWAVSAGTVYLWLVSFFFTPGPTILFLAFAFTGLLIATLVREDIVKVKIVSWDVSTYWKGFSLTFGMIMLIVVFMYVGYEWQQRVYASIQVQKTTAILQTDITKVTEAQTVLLKALNTYFNTNDLRFASEVSLIRPTQLISQTQGVVPAEKLNSDVISDITFAIETARRSAVGDELSVDYRDWLQLGKAYEAATFLGATSTAALAVESYAEAERLNPTSPIPPYFIGRLYTLARGFDVAEAKLKRAVELKPNYTEAVTLLNSVTELNKSGQRSTIVAPKKVNEGQSDESTKGATSTKTNASTGATAGGAKK